MEGWVEGEPEWQPPPPLPSENPLTTFKDTPLDPAVDAAEEARLGKLDIAKSAQPPADYTAAGTWSCVSGVFPYVGCWHYSSISTPP